jgi:hypothetical protein
MYIYASKYKLATISLIASMAFSAQVIADDSIFGFSDSTTRYGDPIGGSAYQNNYYTKPLSNDGSWSYYGGSRTTVNGGYIDHGDNYIPDNSRGSRSDTSYGGGIQYRWGDSAK